jgi:hypothetical protein
MSNSNHKRIDNLRSVLNGFAPGPIPSATEVERALADCWHEFVGNDDHGMESYKLIGRMEQIEWRPPILSFTIERHGGTVLGSTRAELHHWKVNLDEMTAHCSIAGHRTVGPISKPVRQYELRLVAQEIAELIRQGTTDHRLIWKDSDTVHVVIEQIIPTKSGVARTIQGRHKRLRQALEEVLAKDGWQHVGRNVFKRTNVMEQ